MKEKRKINFDEDEDKDLLIKVPSRVFIQIGEVVVGSNRASIKTCQRIAVNTLKQRPVKDYLNYIEKKKTISSLPYVE